MNLIAHYGNMYSINVTELRALFQLTAVYGGYVVENYGRNDDD